MARPTIIFLKTPSTPSDGYDAKFSSSSYAVHFLSVLSHTFLESSLEYLRTQLNSFDATYSGLIFTSQRAVDGFLALYAGPNPPKVPGTDAPVYVVGPATFRALTESPESPFRADPGRVIGQETGNGDALAEFIVRDLSSRKPGTGNEQKKLLFLVGEKRRDVIPKRLAKDGIAVEEVEVYVTIEHPGFETALRAKLGEIPDGDGAVVWIVVFSPQGCQVLQNVLAEEDARAAGKRKIRIATIGPTTAAEIEKLGRNPDVVAEKPSPEGLYNSIESFGA